MPELSENIWVIIPAAGQGSRFSSQIRKQFLSLHGKILLEYTIDVFLANKKIKHVVIPIARKDSVIFQDSYSYQSKISMVQGGETRLESVLNGLKYLKDRSRPNDWVLVHDAVRPCLAQADLDSLIHHVGSDEVGGILATPVRDTIKKVHENTIVGTTPRENLWHALTPQMFRYRILEESLKFCQTHALTVTDESFAVEQCGYQPKVVQAQFPNPKLTYQEDIDTISALLLKKRKGALA